MLRIPSVLFVFAASAALSACAPEPVSIPGLRDFDVGQTAAVLATDDGVFIQGAHEASWARQLDRRCVQVSVSSQFMACLDEDGDVLAIEAEGGSILAPKDHHVEGPIVHVTAGAQHYCVLNEDQSIGCYGDDSHGQVSDTPVGVKAGLINAGTHHTCAILADGSQVSWGEDVEYFTAVEFGEGPEPSTIYAHVDADGWGCSVLSTGRAQCHAGRYVGERAHALIAELHDLDAITDLDITNGAFWAVRADGTVHHSQVESGGEVRTEVLWDPAGLGFVKISAGRDESACAINTEDQLTCWGSGLLDLTPLFEGD